MNSCSLNARNAASGPIGSKTLAANAACPYRQSSAVRDYVIESLARRRRRLALMTSLRATRQVYGSAAQSNRRTAIARAKSGRITHSSVRGRLPSVPIPKFVSICGALIRTSESIRTLATSLVVPLLNPNLGSERSANLCELRVRGTSAASSP